MGIRWNLDGWNSRIPRSSVVVELVRVSAGAKLRRSKNGIERERRSGGDDGGCGGDAVSTDSRGLMAVVFSGRFAQSCGGQFMPKSSMPLSLESSDSAAGEKGFDRLRTREAARRLVEQGLRV